MFLTSNPLRVLIGQVSPRTQTRTYYSGNGYSRITLTHITRMTMTLTLTLPVLQVDLSHEGEKGTKPRVLVISTFCFITLKVLSCVFFN